MKFGVNYTPRGGWFHSWLDFDPGRVAEDMHTIAELGADHVRIFPLWPILQPNRTLIRAQAIDDVATVVRLAHEAGLNSSVDVLQGHLSSFDFLPSWVSTWHRRNLFTDPDVVAGEVALVKALASAIKDQPGATGLTVGNEFIQFAALRHPDADIITPAEAGQWLDTLLSAAREVWPEGTHVHCHDDDLWFDDSHPFTPSSAVTYGDLTTVHSWVFGRVGPRFGVGTPQLTYFARYLCELAAAWSPDPTRGLWLQEIGSPDNYVAAEDGPAFLLDTVDVLMGAKGGGVSPNLEAITWWCSHDVSRSLADFPTLEYSLGLINEGGTIKPIGEAFAEAARRYRGTDSLASSRSGEGSGQETARESLVFDETQWERSATDATHTFFDQWMEYALAGDIRSIELSTNGYIEKTGKMGNVAPFLSTRD